MLGARGEFDSARDETRTRKGRSPADFESAASTNSATQAGEQKLRSAQTTQCPNYAEAKRRKSQTAHRQNSKKSKRRYQPTRLAVAPLGSCALWQFAKSGSS